ncbi:MAG: hypothetical protein Kow0068_19550 [Marinilabiliales bacterium]
MNKDKPRVIKDYSKLDPEIIEQIKLVYPNGFSDHLITFPNKEGKLITALPFETDEKYYLIKMTVTEAERIIELDDDYDDDGILKDNVRAEFEDKYSDFDYLSDNDNVTGDDDDY